MRRTSFPISGGAGVLLCRSVSVVALAASLAGCAASQQTQDNPSYSGVPARPQVAVAAPPQVTAEADGLPQQLPPRVRRFAEPDDPTEPFSPNYGPAPAERKQRKPEPLRQLKPVPFRKAGMSDDEAERLIAQAIAAHEVLRQ